jgi:hypothetical protein
MQIAAVLHVHENTELVLDTLDALRTWVTKDVLVVVDGKYWRRWGRKIELPAYKLEGFKHGHFVASYRNHVLGMMHAAKLWPDADWYLHTEYDTLFASDSFKQDLEESEKDGAWCVGMTHQKDSFRLLLLEALLNTSINDYHYLIGCCHFYKSDLIKKMVELNFFNRFLNLTNGFSIGRFPGFEKYCLMEYLFPTLAALWGGKVKELAHWTEHFGGGEYKKYPVRFRPELTWKENFPQASIFHPLKELNAPIRQYHQRKRNGQKLQG